MLLRIQKTQSPLSWRLSQGRELTDLSKALTLETPSVHRVHLHTENLTIFLLKTLFSFSNYSLTTSIWNKPELVCNITLWSIWIKNSTALCHNSIFYMAFHHSWYFAEFGKYVQYCIDTGLSCKSDDDNTIEVYSHDYRKHGSAEKLQEVIHSLNLCSVSIF